jgi:four helix bundle protein
MRRAVVSFTSNIAEGFSRKSSKEKSQFYNNAKGSMTELQNQLLIAKDVGYLSKGAFNELADQSVITNKLLTGLLRATRQLRYES